jgi:hypothetical protein
MFLGDEQGALKQRIRNVQSATRAARPRVKSAVAGASKAAEAVISAVRG